MPCFIFVGWGHSIAGHLYTVQDGLWYDQDESVLEGSYLVWFRAPLSRSSHIFMHGICPLSFRFSCSVAWRCWNSSWRWSSHKLLLTARWTVESLPKRTIAFCSAWWCPDEACVLMRIVYIAIIECIPELETVCDSIFCWKEGVWSCVLPGPWLKLDCWWDG